MNKEQKAEEDLLVREFKNSIEFLSTELIESYVIINRLNNRCNFLSHKLHEHDRKNTATTDKLITV